MAKGVDPMLIGLDVGHSNVKYAGPQGRGHFESVYGLEVAGISFAGMTAARKAFTIRRDGQSIAIGRDVDNLGTIRNQTLDRSRVLSIDYSILTDAAIAAALYPYSGEVAPVFNVPVVWYERRSEVKAHLAGLHKIGYQDRELTYTIKEENIRVLPEGFAALCREMLDELGEVCDDRFERVAVGVVDIGMQTTDLTLYDELSLVKAKSRGFDVALKQALEIAQRRAELELNHFFTLEQIDRALNDSEKERLYVGKYDHTDDVLAWFDEGMGHVTQAVIGHIRSLWQGGNDAQIILCAGGTGGKHSGPTLQDTFEQALLLADPAYANAEGAYRYGLMKEREKYVA